MFPGTKAGIAARALKAEPATHEMLRVFYITTDVNSRRIFGWAMYDWANSAFSTIVVTTLLGPYLTMLAESAGGIDLAGFNVKPAAFFPACVSVSVVMQVFFLPVLGSLADQSRFKKQLLVLFAVFGAGFTAALYFAAPGFMDLGLEQVVLMGGFLFIMANFCFGASIVLCNGFLPDIASPSERDRISSMGWAVGYLGGGIALLAALAFFAFVSDKAMAVRLSLALAGAWWLAFTLAFPARFLPSCPPEKACGTGGFKAGQGFRQVIGTLSTMHRNYPETLRFLAAYLVYNDGIQTVIVVAALFASTELGTSNQNLLILILMIQFAAFFGSLLFGWLAGRIGAKKSIMISLLIWAAISIYAYAFLYNTTQLFFLGAASALVLGGSQALSRSLYSQLIPRQNETEYFGFYEISERGTSWIGPLVFAGAVQFTGSTRIAILSLVVFFAAGLYILAAVNVKRGMAAAGNDFSGVIL